MRVAVAMSGGIDSAVSALLLKEKGYDVTGITACFCGSSHIADAQAVASYIGIEHITVSLEEPFNEQVTRLFCREYSIGRTPSPCIICNDTMKFGALFEAARAAGCTHIATGHYARVGITETGRYYITKGADAAKDQSYFLCMLKQSVLPYILFPLGDLTKREIRDRARTKNFPIAEKPDSQEICFIPDDDYAGYIQKHSENIPPAGDIVNSEGKILGRHKGIHLYTIGQRRGMGIAYPEPLYVLSLDAVHNRVIAGTRRELDQTGLFASSVNFMKYPSIETMKVCVKTRSTQTGSAAVISMEEGRLKVVFDQTQIGISPGQAAVAYDEDGDIICSGWIDESF